ncbi:hypothetical protein EBT31_00930 [bacterium]|nr:hypothetical protein [bacterium]
MNFNGFAKKLFAAWMVIFFIATPIAGARIAYAQNSTVADAPRVLEWIKNAVTDFITNTMQAAIVTALVNAVSFAADRLAYDAAVRIVTGGSAEEPLFDGTPDGEYLKELAMGAAGEAIGSLSETIEDAGGLLSNFDLCAPSTPYILLQFKLGIKGVFDRPEPKCDFNKMFGEEGTWQAFIADLEGYKAPFKNQLVLAELANMYDPQKAEFGAGLGVYTDVFGETTFLPLIGVQKKLNDGGFKDVVDFITGNVETPADILSTQVKDAQKNSGDVRQQATFAMLGNKDLIRQVGIHAASVFTNTLLSKLQERIWMGLFDFDVTQVDPFDPESFALGTQQAAADRYRSLLTAAPLQITNYSILSEFITCPGSSTRGLYNCVADSNFVSAVARAESGAPLTIEEAINDGLINGDWPLIPSSDAARNQDAFCYTYGFCYGNLVKLRKARVISIGWELAANSSANSAESPVTLQEVINGFNSCGPDGLPDDNHPWCKMIDPDWVLKYPDTQCRMQAYGELLLTKEADERAQVCVDMPSCIAEDENGNCIGGYGYCVAEENTWQFRGESCPEYAASCLVFEDSAGDDIALLKNTVDPGPCTSDTVGCRWYNTVKEQQDDGTFAFAAIDDIAGADADGETYASRIYFNSQIEDCDKEEGGCSTLIERDTDLRLNVVLNPSFEEDDDSDDRPDGWFDYHLAGTSWPSTVSLDGSVAREGEVAISPGSGGRGALYQPGIELTQASTYTLSFYARQATDAGTDTVSVGLALKDEEGAGIDIEGLAIIGDCDDSYVDIFGATRTDGVEIENMQPDGASYERFSCTFTVPPLPEPSLRVFGDLYVLAFDGYVDSMQLEQGEDTSTPVNGYSDADYTTVVAKVAPAYLGCTGSEDDPAECANYAQVCSEQDMGCTMYTPTNGDPALSGIATELDSCPSECAGYDTYRQEATLYEPDGIDAVYFIPDTATECSAEEVGCDEFTNLATEEQEYYSFLRACVTETQAAGTEATYYTWEGSDEDGYQLQTWTLLESDLGSSSYTHTGTDGVTDAAPNLAPCSNWTTTDEGITCNDSADDDGDGYYDWDTEDCNSRADIFRNADCREFYDESGNIHYREWTKTVTIHNSCQAYRKTEVAGETAAAQQITCEDSGGYYVGDSGECRYYGYPEESTSCDASANGCRAYAGGRSRNSRLVLEEIFESGTLNQWDAASASYATYSNESLASDGHSMLMTGPVTSFIADNGGTCTTEGGCAGTALSFGGECTVAEDDGYCGTLHNELFVGKTYTVSVVAKGTGTLEVGFDFEADPSSPSIDLAFDSAVELEDGWQQITLGPLIMDAEDYPRFGDGTSLVLVPTGSAYVDNIVLREGEENITVIRDSWVTPASCDQSVTGDVSPQYYLGCQEYTTQDDETEYLKSFSSLCDEDEVGCDAFFKTQESASHTAKTVNATCNNIDDDGDSEPDTATSATACYYFYESSADFDEASPYLCTIAAGKSSCLFSMDGFTPAWGLGETAVSYGPETTIVPADQAMFLVVTDEVTCSASSAGCTEFGDPDWSQDRNSTDGAESVYFLNLPDEYDSTLCAHEELFCDAFTTNQAATYYFKHPLDQKCEYRTDVTINGVGYTGWFREGTQEFCYGTCEDSGGNEGDACGSSADCGSGETCNAQNPSYVIGGDESGIWKSGDGGFGGWAGTCDAAYDTCSEFQDTLAQDDGEIYGMSDGTSYFYLNNDTLSEYGLSDSQKCDGQVSLKNGCAMFYDTSNTSLTANASATEVSSRHADELFGTEPYGLVDPIDCENGGDATITTSDGLEIDLCATRCIYDYGEVYDLTDGDTYRAKLVSELSFGRDYDRDDLFVFGGSCVDSTDCALVESESGRSVEAVTCGTQVRVDPGLFGSLGFSAWTEDELNANFDWVPRQENDVNTVLKVNRDRACSEWLACASDNPRWDEDTASFINTCTDIELCTDYDATTGTSSCAEWDMEEPDVLFDKEWYASRDTSWYGNEYSGMAIPDLFPVQSLSQADVSPIAYCVYGASTDSPSLASDSSCEAVGEACMAGMGICMSPEATEAAGLIDEVEYALVLDAGSCSEDYGNACAVGYCSSNGAACASSDQCGDGDCIVGACYDLDEDASGDPVLCQTAADCSEGQACYSGACAEVGNDVAIEDYDSETAEASTCSSEEIFIPAAELKLGSCINSKCLLTPDGEAYANGVTEGKICRAYPEGTSPFPNEVVEAWYDPSDQGTIDTDPTYDALPYDLLSGFENVEACAYGEVCDCSYTKVSFGEGMETRYYNQDWDPEFSICGGDLDGDGEEEADTDAGEICTNGSTCESGSCIAVADQLGVCQGGERSGGYCTEDEQCGDGSTCAKSTREDVIYGLNGFCLEKDTSLNILGDRTKQACISWLPVDRLQGDTDLQAKYASAGFFEDIYMCADVQAFSTITPSPSSVIQDGYAEGVACAESDNSSVSNDEDAWMTSDAACDQAVHCPEGFFAIMGARARGAGVSNNYSADTCRDGVGDNDCPYICVPENSAKYVESDGEVEYDYESCDPSEDSRISNEGTSNDGTRVWYASLNPKEGGGDTSSGSSDSEERTYGHFDKVADDYQDCKVRGIYMRGGEYAEADIFYDVLDITDYPQSDGADDTESSSGGAGYRNLWMNASESYADRFHDAMDENVACSVVVQVSSNDEGSYAWTDRVYNGHTLQSDLSSNVEYNQETTPGIFGAINLDKPVQEYEAPFYVAQCSDNYHGGDDITIATGVTFDSCPSGYPDVGTLGDPASELLQARSYIPFTFTGSWDGVGYGWDGHPYAYVSDTSSYYFYTATSEPLQYSLESITQVFASVADAALWIWKGDFTGEREYIDGDWGDVADYFSVLPTETSLWANYDADDEAYDVRPAEGVPPTVWAVDVGSCSDDGLMCEEGTESAITLNGQETGDQSGIQFFNATIKFYAAADKNQLPIRQVMIDWGDGMQTGSDDDENYFKNARGLQDGQQESQCDLESDWGLTSESCDPYYFNYNHVYTCTSETLRGDRCDDSDGDGEYDEFPCAIDETGDDVADSCVFKPRVHVRDNWGWCTGVCSSSNDASYSGNETTCYDYEGSISGSDSTDECNYETINSNYNPWVEYDGIITVTP